jgi:hypothetical protein
VGGCGGWGQRSLAIVVIRLGDDAQGLFKDLPELDRLVCTADMMRGALPHDALLTVRGQEKVGRVLSSAPLDLVDLLLDFERLEVVELGLVRLELCVELVLAALFLGCQSDKRCCGEHGGAPRTDSFRSKSTTRPPLSPVAR